MNDKILQNPFETAGITTKDTLVTQEKLYEQLKNAEENFLKKAREEVDQQLQRAQLSVITILAFFASFIAFVTSEFMILKSAEGFRQKMGFSLVLLACLLGFVVTLNYVAKATLERNMYAYIPVIIGAIVLLFIGIACCA
jgi:cation transport ATPase